jgi:membrane-bound ClpP family serine protease
MLGTTINHCIFWGSVLIGLAVTAFQLSERVRTQVMKLTGFLKKESKIIGKECLVVRPVRPGVVGKIHLREPWKGQRDWEVVSSHQMKIGSIARVVGCMSDRLIIERRTA